MRAFLLFSLPVFLAVASEPLANCTYTEAKTIRMYSELLTTCAQHMECIEGEDDDGNRRRLQEEDENLVAKYSCYCDYCTDYMYNLQESCNVCNSINYCAVMNEDGECEAEEDAEEDQSFFQQYCMLDSLVVMPHADSFCGMVQKTSSTCLQEMEYMVTPPEAEEEDENDDDNNDDGRRRLEEDDEQDMEMFAQEIARCWTAPFAAQDNYQSHEYCNYVCEQYANSTYEYMTNELPAQTCGLSVSYYEEDSMSAFYLPKPVQHQGMMCVASSCSSDDLGLMSDYLVNMARYSQFLRFDIEGDDNNNNDQQQDGELQFQSDNRIAETKGAWRCDGAGASGKIENDDFPEDDECGKNNNDGDGEENDDEPKEGEMFVIATIVLGLCATVFFCLFVYYYRQTEVLKTGMNHKTSLVGNESKGVRSNI